LFLDFLLSRRAREIFASYGFVPPIDSERPKGMEAGRPRS
jgi:hypothetical protein